MSKKINIGLDMGIASVGWAVVDADEIKVYDAGSRLFPEAGGSNSATTSAEDRRIKRSIRRQKRRKKLRINDFKNLCAKFNLVSENDTDFWALPISEVNILDLKIKALDEKITQQEFIKLLLSYIKNRGSFNLKDEILSEENSNLTPEELEKELKEAESKLPCFIQKENFDKNGAFRTSSNRMSHEKLEEEINKIYEKQTELKSINISKEFMDDYFEIFNRKREYYEGPNDPSPFGWGKDEEEFYNRLVGKDTYDETALRAPKLGIYANTFNLLNDLNNIKIKNENRETPYLTKDEKQTIIEKMISGEIKSKSLSLTTLCKEIGVSEKNVEGYRENETKDKSLFTNFKSLEMFKKQLEDKKLPAEWISIKNIDLLEEIVSILTKSQSSNNAFSNIQKTLLENKEIININVDKINVISKQLSILFSEFTGSHALSNKTIQRVLRTMFEEPKNSQTVMAEMNIKPKYKFEIRGSDYIPVLSDKINEMFISPAVKRSLIQALKVIKEIQKQFKDYEINNICIELAREKNSEDVKNHLKEIQRRNKDLNDKITNDFGVDAKQISKKMLKKLKLADEQNFTCLYCGRKIDRSELIHNDFAFEIDHIIPKSVSFDSSFVNLVLVHNDENGHKGKMTSFQYINSLKSPISFEQFKTIIFENYKASLDNSKTRKYIQNKINNLLNPIDLSDLDSVVEFINKNLNDTRYSTSEIKEYIEQYKASSNAGFKIKTLNGKVTSNIRYEILNLKKKDRDDYSHHAIDAIVIAYSDSIVKLFKKRDVDKEEIIEKFKPLKTIIENFDYKFTKMQIKNINKELFDETLYACKPKINDPEGEFYQISKISIYSDETKKLKKLTEIFIDRKYTTLMELSDEKTFNYLVSLFNEYKPGTKHLNAKGEEKTIKNPFVFVKDELGIDILTKKSENKPETETPIKFIKYYSNKMGNILDMSHKYSVDSTKTKIAFTSLNPIKLRVFKSKSTGKFKVIPLNAQVIKQIVNEEITKIDESKYDKILATNGIHLNEYEHMFDLNPRGNMIYIRDNKKYPEGKIFEVVGSKTKGVLELDYIEKLKLTNERIVLSTSTFIEFKKVYKNILGNKIIFVEKE